MNDYINDEHFLTLVNSGKTLSAKEKRYVAQTISENQQLITQQKAISLVVSSPQQRFPFLSEGLRLL